MVNLLRGLVVPAAAVVLLVGCGSDDGGSAGTAPSDPGTLPASVPTTAPPTTGAPTTGVAATDPSDMTEVTVGDSQVDGDIQEIVVDADDPATAGQVVPVALGQTVVLRLVSDTDREYHVHGFELEGTAPAGTEHTFEFTADQAGTFEVEDHVEDRLILVLEVS